MRLDPQRDEGSNPIINHVTEPRKDLKTRKKYTRRVENLDTCTEIYESSYKLAGGKTPWTRGSLLHDCQNIEGSIEPSSSAKCGEWRDPPSKPPCQPKIEGSLAKVKADPMELRPWGHFLPFSRELTTKLMSFRSSIPGMLILREAFVREVIVAVVEPWVSRDWLFTYSTRGGHSTGDQTSQASTWEKLCPGDPENTGVHVIYR
jgi:hypothetical protein